jgi:hypothetical protein
MVCGLGAKNAIGRQMQIRDKKILRYVVRLLGAGNETILKRREQSENDGIKAIRVVRRNTRPRGAIEITRNIEQWKMLETTGQRTG